MYTTQNVLSNAMYKLKDILNWHFSHSQIFFSLCLRTKFPTYQTHHAIRTEWSLATFWEDSDLAKYLNTFFAEISNEIFLTIKQRLKKISMNINY